MFPRPDFMASSRLNFAENLLFPKTITPLDPSSPAAITLTELTPHPPPPSATTSWAELRDAVRRCSNALRALGLKPHDVVAGYVSNHVEALVAMLSAAAIGAVWTSISPDSGVSAVLDRLGQIAPRVLFADNGVVYNGKRWPGGEKLTEIVKALRGKGLELVVLVETLDHVVLDDAGLGEVVVYGEFLKGASDEELTFEQLPPSHPLYILYSSGTTGTPKAIVHTALGTLLQHKKELALHCDMSPASRMLYYTTTSWMMWHWSTSALAVGATLVLYSGSPFRPNSYMSLPILLSELKITHFGTSAAYLCTLETNGVKPMQENIDLSNLRAIYSTASPLPPSTFKYVSENFSKQANLASITGGTDIISLFGAPCPLLPVRVGLIQCAGLGMAIQSATSETGAQVPSGSPGELVCVKPFPAQPLTFFGPDGEAKYRAAYFERFPDVWHHGDFVQIPDPATGGLVMMGRSDGVLKPAGVRFGSAEIYNVLVRFFGGEVEDAVCVGRRREEDRDETVCLFLAMKGGCELDGGMRDRIKGVIKTELSPRHVPGIIEVAGGGIPKTSNGKKYVFLGLE